MIKNDPQKKSQMEAKLLKINVKNGDPEVKSQKIKPKWATLVKEKIRKPKINKAQDKS